MKDVFLSIPTLLMSATVILKILEYIRVLLKLFLPLQIYKQLFDKLNLTDVMSLIRKPGYEYHAFLVPGGRTISKISKTIIFIDFIDNVIKKTKYLQSRLFNSI